ncbi:hypothetical protein ATE47_13300 [Chryseobacterium sp. IHB B 17019]|jgi:hypothetical protein|uniref:Uncharacterized protein n=1 Tax=Chryseobacterium geocarposphaerae TaxID=1416776 RepID=A0ABU1LGJ3_9FLAO|nr:hypothetical protein ATE47_13300 [Chryseobacterium sp. IHB B 17019]MDR6405843.1 hypothetical protein [Chryseobacterium geocarposphaerae]MDR6698993.1 hypothetical protein [Chryseobacterium ginsenosidimutans]
MKKFIIYLISILISIELFVLMSKAWSYIMLNLASNEKEVSIKTISICSAWMIVFIGLSIISIYFFIKFIKNLYNLIKKS